MNKSNLEIMRKQQIPKVFYILKCMIDTGNYWSNITKNINFKIDSNNNINFEKPDRNYNFEFIYIKDKINEYFLTLPNEVIDSLGYKHENIISIKKDEYDELLLKSNKLDELKRNGLRFL